MTKVDSSDVLFCIVTLERFLDLIEEASGARYASVAELVGWLEHQGGQWPRLDGADDLEDSAIYQHLAPLHTPRSRVLVVSEVSYKRGSGAFEMKADHLPVFVDSHRGLFREVLFNGDVLFLDPDEGVLVMFHHEGVFGRFSLKPARAG